MELIKGKHLLGKSGSSIQQGITTDQMQDEINYLTAIGIMDALSGNEAIRSNKVAEIQATINCMG